MVWENGLLICLLGFCIYYQYWESHLPEYPSTYQLQQNPIPTNHFNSGKATAAISELWFEWVPVIMKVSAQPWKTSEVLFYLLWPCIRYVFIWSTINPVLPQKDVLSLWCFKCTSLSQKVLNIQKILLQEKKIWIWKFVNWQINLICSLKILV